MKKKIKNLRKKLKNDKKEPKKIMRTKLFKILQNLMNKKKHMIS